MKKPPIPAELAAFIKKGRTCFHAPDGDWELRIESRADSDYGKHLPPRSYVIAENRSGDCLFLMLNAATKFKPQVGVYWHEEEACDDYPTSLSDLMAARPSKAPPGSASKSAGGVLPSPEKLEQALASDDTDVWSNFKKSRFGIETLPMLRRLLTNERVTVVIHAAESIGRLGPEAGESPAARESMPYGHGQRGEGNLESQLQLVGSKCWSYSSYLNTYCACLEALVALEYHDDLLDFIHKYIGLDFDLETNFQALARIGTPDALDLMRRAEAFWLPELNLSDAKQIKAIIASAGKSSGGKKAKK